MNALMNPGGSLTMTSREIAELTGKSHGNVMRDIRAMMDALEQDSKLNPVCKSTTYAGTNGQTYDQYELDKDTCLTLLLGYDAVARMKVVKRWQELERAGDQPKVPQSMPEALRLAAEAIEQCDRLALENKAQAEALAKAQPKAEALDRIATADGSLCLTDAAKTLQVQPRKFMQLLQEKGWVYRRPMGTGWLAYQDRIQAGQLEHKVTKGEKSDGSEWASTQVRVTPKGLTKLAQDLETH